MGDDFREPPRGRLFGVPFGRADHKLGGPAEQVFPGGGRGVRPGLRRVPLPGGRERLADRVEMLLLDAEFAVRPPQAFEVGGQLTVIIADRYDAAQSLVKPYSLGVHGGREHRPCGRLAGEEMTVEIGHSRVGYRINRGEEFSQRIGTGISHDVRRSRPGPARKRIFAGLLPLPVSRGDLRVPLSRRDPMPSWRTAAIGGRARVLARPASLPGPCPRPCPRPSILQCPTRGVSSAADSGRPDFNVRII